MATKSKASASPPDEVTVPRSVLKQFVSLVEGLEQADKAYMTCQASLFRDYVQGAYKAPKVRGAVERARNALEAQETPAAE